MINRSAARDKPSTKSRSRENKLKARTLQQRMVAAAKKLSKGATLACALETTTGKWKSKEKTGRWSQLRPENKNEISDLETASPQNENEQHKARRENKVFIEIQDTITTNPRIPPSSLPYLISGMKNMFLTHFYSSHYDNEIGK
jgi:hypothetical protein